ncbi:protein of unknown function [Proteiniborus ethanoligenes]|uniref:DUF4368 domain-containing protein n=1 Tax=Proteiniborus ethanoligenes TaxID=415015 RepID=A0A1H3JYE9_9FIRM|nr:DUF4368 domain-containing protein [Proteiniborus ethanoligenes]SDY44956.1 protein of unknown function [Proteiniborus ethanoligenes]
MSRDYEKEQKLLMGKVSSLKEKLSKAKEEALNTDRFLKLVKRYSEIKELDAEIIREFGTK